ncbi:hypothetical protein BV20DRAFT_415 [Pilatotrama ljubarskyi]|nr:hypothetical protein BV20DRAFT_415 [Pilatotrama ljubarskyi]
MSAPGPWRDAAPASRVPYPPFPLPPPPPPPPPPPMADHGCAGAGRQTFCSAPIPGFYSPSLAQPAPGLPFARGAPAFPRPELPPSLMPGRKPTPSMSRSQSDDYFFQRESSTFPRHANTSPVPALPRKPDITQPPLPPKPLRSPPTSPPVLYGMAPGAPSYSGMDSSLVPSAPPPPPGMDHEDDVVLSRVLEMSAQESQRERELARQRQEALRAEQEQLAQALEASLRISSPPFAPEADGRSTTFITSSPEQGASSLPLHSPVLDISPNGPFDDHARRSSGNSNPHVAQQIMDDEALALQLAQEEERLAEQERRRETTGAHSRKPSQIGPGLGLADGPPQYDDAVSSPPVASPEFYNSSVSAHLSPNVAGPSRSPSPRLHLGRSISEKPVPPKSTTPEQRMSRSQSMGESAPSSSTALLAPGPPGGRPSSIVSSDWDPPDEPGRLIPSSPPPASDVPANTQYLDSELLAGLCKFNRARTRFRLLMLA